jgi:hypothetical protein
MNLQRFLPALVEMMTLSKGTLSARLLDTDYFGLVIKMETLP